MCRLICPIHPKMRWADYYGLLGRRFRKAHFDPITAWCRRVGIESTGHMIAENSTESSALYNGDPLHALKGLTVPGMDEIGTRLEPGKIEWITFAVAQHSKSLFRAIRNA